MKAGVMSSGRTMRGHFSLFTPQCPFRQSPASETAWLLISLVWSDKLTQPLVLSLTQCPEAQSASEFLLIVICSLPNTSQHAPVFFLHS